MAKWNKSDIIPNRGIYGVNGKYIWVNKENPKKVLEIQKVMGGGSTVILHRGDGYVDTFPESGTGFKHRAIALKYARQLLKTI